jgi:PAS domain S-box-containing protein
MTSASDTGRTGYLDRILRWHRTRLIDPLFSTTAPEIRRRIQLLSSLLLIFLLFTVMGLVFTSLSGTGRNSFYRFLLATLALVAPLYVLSRTRLYNLAVGVTLAFMTAFPFVALVLRGDYSAERLQAVLLWLVVGFLLGVSLLSLKSALALIAVNFVAILALPLAISVITYPALIPALGFLGTAAALILANIRYRDLVEADRRAELLREKNFSDDIINGLPGLFFMYDAQGTLIRCNRRLEEAIGCSFHELRQRSIADLFDQADRAAVGQAVAHVLAEGAVTLQVNLLSRDGQATPYYLTALHGTIGDQPHLLGFGIDVTARRQAEEQLGKNERRYRALFEQTNDGVFILDMDRKILAVNQRISDMLGYTADELVGMSPAQLVAPEEQAASLEKHRLMLAGQSLPFYERTYLRKDGTRVTAELNVAMVYDQAGRPLHLQSIARDITERKQAEREIQSLARFPAENPQPVLRLDQAGTILYTNEASRLLLQDWAAEVGGQAPPFWQAQVADALDSQSKRTVEVTCGEVVYSFVVVPVSHGGYVNLYGLDITERKSAEAEREKLIAELETRNAELERFTYTVSHDLKSPLVTIRGFLGFLEKDAMSGSMDRFRDDVARIAAATAKMQRLLDDLLELSRIGRLMNPPQAVPFAAIVHEALDLVRARIEACGPEIIVAPDLPIVYGDRVRLVEVIQNLVDNACKFLGHQPDPRIEIGQNGDDANGWPILFVRDNGIGIEPQYCQRIFGLFNKLDAQTDGTGVGLALVKRIIEVHGGRIWVESAGAGHGATFCFTLPRSQEQRTK